MIKFLMFFLIAYGALAAPLSTTQPAGTITMYHIIITADDEGAGVQGLAEVLPNTSGNPIVLRFDNAVDLQAQATPETVPVKITGDQLEVRPPSTDDPVKLEFQYYRNWPTDTKTPLNFLLPPSLPVDTVMISLPIAGLKFETKGLKKTHLESQEVYTAFDLAPENDVWVAIYPPKTWWGHAAGRFVVLASAAILIAFLIMRIGWRRHA